VSKSHWIGTALGLALFSIALPSCSNGGSSPGQNQSGAQEAPTPKLSWNKSTEKQVLDAIAQAPANGLKPDLFLKGDLPKDDAERGARALRPARRLRGA